MSNFFLILTISDCLPFISMEAELRAINGALVRCIMLGVLIFGTSTSAQERRSSAVTEQFQREHPCPSTGQTSGPCPGYIKDHIKSLGCGGPDDPANLQWQTVADAAAKDKWELDCTRYELGGYQKAHDGGHDPGGIILRGWQ
jgi:hypothetical protein